MAKAPAYVKEFMKSVPSIWDDVKFIDGFPGKFVVLARRSGDRWYFSGINAEKSTREVSIDLKAFKVGSISAITDGGGGNLSFAQSQLQADSQGRVKMTLQPRGGFVGVAQSAR